MAVKYDTVYYWASDLDGEGWCEAELVGTVAETVEALTKRGYVALPGLRSIGAPEGKPGMYDKRGLDRNG